MRSVCLEHEVNGACRLLPELWQALAESLWVCVFAASPEISARLASNQQQQSAADAVHIYIKWQTAMNFTTKMLISLFQQYRLKLWVELNLRKQHWAVQVFLTCSPVKTVYLLYLATVLRRTLINSLTKENRTYGVQVVHLSPDPRSSDISLFSHSTLNAEIYVWIGLIQAQRKKKKALNCLKTLDCSYSNKFPPFLENLLLPFLPSIS